MTVKVVTVGIEGLKHAAACNAGQPSSPLLPYKQEGGIALGHKEVFYGPRRQFVWKHLLLAPAALLLSACGGSDSDGEGEEVPSTLLARGYTGIQTAANYVVRDLIAWSDLWALHATRFPSAPPARPGVDFQTHMVVGTHAGIRPDGCYSLNVARLLQEGQGSTLVQYREITPAPGAGCTLAFIDLFSLAKVPASPGPVRFQKVN